MKIDTVMGTRLYLFLVAIILSNIGCIFWLQHVISHQQTSHLSAKPLAPVNGLQHGFRHTWPINDLPAVAMPIEDTPRYQLNSTDADLEWEALLPNDGVIYLGPQRKPHTISMFHQLRCLDMLRRHIMRLDWPQSDSGLMPASAEEHDLTQHCLGYLRQMVVCHADTGLEGFAGKYGETREGLARCKDWRVVYDALWRNNIEW